MPHSNFLSFGKANKYNVCCVIMSEYVHDTCVINESSDFNTNDAAYWPDEAIDGCFAVNDIKRYVWWIRLRDNQQPYVMTIRIAMSLCWLQHRNDVLHINAVKPDTINTVQWIHEGCDDSVSVVHDEEAHRLVARYNAMNVCHAQLRSAVQSHMTQVAASVDVYHVLQFVVDWVHDNVCWAVYHPRCVSRSRVRYDSFVWHQLSYESMYRWHLAEYQSHQSIDLCDSVLVSVHCSMIALHARMMHTLLVNRLATLVALINDTMAEIVVWQLCDQARWCHTVDIAHEMVSKTYWLIGKAVLFWLRARRMVLSIGRTTYCWWHACAQFQYDRFC